MSERGVLAAGLEAGYQGGKRALVELVGPCEGID